MVSIHHVIIPLPRVSNARLPGNYPPYWAVLVGPTSHGGGLSGWHPKGYWVYEPGLDKGKCHVRHDDITVPPTAVLNAWYRYEGTVPAGIDVLSLGKAYVLVASLRVHLPTRLRP